MKLEPIKKAKLPKYAAALAAAAVTASMLTGCGLISDFFDQVRDASYGGIVPAQIESEVPEESSSSEEDSK